MQAALDSAAIAGARSYADEGDSGIAQSAAEAQYAKASGDGASGSITSFNVSPEGIVEVTATSNLETTFLSVVGVNEVELGVNSTAVMSGKDLELSITLDVTGSMANDLPDLKFAANDLLDIVLTASDKERRVAIVPFSQAVNGAIISMRLRATKPRMQTVTAGSTQCRQAHRTGATTTACTRTTGTGASSAIHGVRLLVSKCITEP